MLKLKHLGDALRQERVMAAGPAERRACCHTRYGQPHTVKCQEHPLGRHCQNGGDVCLAGNADGICCPADSCDIDDGARPLPPAF